MTQLKAKIYYLLLVMATSAQALPTDKEQVMHVVADSANLSQQNHTGTYTGHVEFIQGTTNIHATKAITKGNNKNQLTLAIASGTKEAQAHYWTQSETGKPPFHAYADTITYYPLRHIIELKGNARIVQGDNSMSAALITYDTIKQHIITQSSGTTRTTIVFHPKQLPK